MLFINERQWKSQIFVDTEKFSTKSESIANFAFLTFPFIANVFRLMSKAWNKSINMGNTFNESYFKSQVASKSSP